MEGITFSSSDSMISSVDNEQIIYTYPSQEETCVSISDEDISTTEIVLEKEEISQLKRDNLDEIVLTEAQLLTQHEVFLYDESTGELQKYLYIPKAEDDKQDLSTFSYVSHDENLAESAESDLNHRDLVDFPSHFLSELSPTTEEVGVENTFDFMKQCDDDNKTSCSICRKILLKGEYKLHLKDEHSDVRLGCPKCSQTYRTPDLLNAHYQHFHINAVDNDYTILKSGKSALRNVRLLLKCKSCLTLVPEMTKHRCEVSKKEESPPKQRRTQLPCSICNKSFKSQREFTNHRRRKDFCRPPAIEPPQQVRRIGIIRKSLRG